MFEVGDVLSEVLYSDTRQWDVVAVTAKTITIRPRKNTNGIVRREGELGTPHVVWTKTDPDPEAATKVVRLRKDGTFRSYPRGNALKLALKVKGEFAVRTDYRM